MTKEQAEMALQFMQRAQIAGAEVPAWVDVCDALRGIAVPRPSLPPATAVEIDD